LAACATTPAPPAQSVHAPPAADPLARPALAVRISDAPGYNIGDLTATLRDAVARTSGVVAVDEISVKNELAACVEMPCATAMQDQFKDADLVVTSAVSRVGDVFLARVEVNKGIQSMVRVNATSNDARAALEDAGWQAGAALRKKLIDQGTPRASGPTNEGGAPPDPLPEAAP
jgi:hypothetical protein